MAFSAVAFGQGQNLQSPAKVLSPGSTTAGVLNLREGKNNGVNEIGLSVPASLTADYRFILPARADITVGDCINIASVTAAAGSVPELVNWGTAPCSSTGGVNITQDWPNTFRLSRATRTTQQQLQWNIGAGGTTGSFAIGTLSASSPTGEASFTFFNNGTEMGRFNEDGSFYASGTINAVNAVITNDASVAGYLSANGGLFSYENFDLRLSLVPTVDNQTDIGSLSPLRRVAHLYSRYVDNEGPFLSNNGGIYLWPAGGQMGRIDASMGVYNPFDSAASKKYTFADRSGGPASMDIDADVTGTQRYIFNDTSSNPMVIFERTPVNRAIFDMDLIPNSASYAVGGSGNPWSKAWLTNLSVAGTVDTSLTFSSEANIYPISGATSSNLGSSARRWTNSKIGTGSFYTQLRVETGGTFLINDAAPVGYVLTKDGSGNYVGTAPAGGGVTSVNAGNGISVFPNTGATVVTNTLVGATASGQNIGAAGSALGTIWTGFVGSSGSRVSNMFTENETVYTALRLNGGSGALLQIQSGASILTSAGTSGATSVVNVTCFGGSLGQLTFTDGIFTGKTGGGC